MRTPNVNPRDQAVLAYFEFQKVRNGSRDPQMAALAEGLGYLANAVAVIAARQEQQDRPRG